ncbi:MAG: 50S ribosomal protein L21 [Deltaproteobacteria bacterium]|nr:50S ribosomal protein L21 [Deltaproteobacteria bacterium]MDD9854058.1 50S ribosomal protein L21 [Deltaproteobacteria bacterium]
MSYAVVRSGGKQVRVHPGQAVRVERLAGEVGDAITFDEVLLVGGDGAPRIGTPLVQGASVRGVITAQARWPKITVFKMKRRKNYRSKNGHRQHYTEVRVDSIEG